MGQRRRGLPGAACVPWSDYSGISGRFGPERVVDLVRNTHSCLIQAGDLGAEMTAQDAIDVWRVYLRYKEERLADGLKYDWDDLSAGVIGELLVDTTPRRYMHIVIDEGQDFSPQMLRSLALAVDPAGSLTFFGDVAQQIYGNRISWRSAGLRVTEPVIFEENHRNTREIAALGLAISVMKPFEGQADMVAPRSPKAGGPLPTITKCDDVGMELATAIAAAKANAQHQSVAILVKDSRAADRIMVALKNSGGRDIRPHRLHRDMALWVDGPGLWYGTYHAAKGFEFDMVILPFLNAESIPDPGVVESKGLENAETEFSRLLYVAVTRAKRELGITFSSTLTSLLPNNPALYQWT